MNNLHLSLTNVKNESRMFKETKSIIKLGTIEQIYIVGLWEDELLEFEEFESNISIYRIKLKSRSWSKNLLIQLFKYIEFSSRTIKYIRNKNIRIVNIHSLGLLPLGLLLRKIYKVKLVYDTHELETETNGLRGIRKKLLKTLEKRLIKKTDIVFVVSENIADWYKNEYNIVRPTVVLNSPKLFNPQKRNHFRKNLDIKNDSVIVLYQGGLFRGRGVELLLETFQNRKDDKVVIVFMGYGELEEHIKDVSQKSNNIFFHPAVAPDVVLEYTSSADIGISFIENTCLSYYYCLPNKLFEYAMAGLPVIVSNMKEMRELVDTYNMGIVVEDENGEFLNKAIDKLLCLDIDILKANSRKCAEQNSWIEQEKKMIAMYKELKYDTK